MTTPTITLTGIQPTGELHLGNYAGAVRPLAELAARPARETLVFVADLHALNRRPDPDRLRDRTRRMAAALLACGLDHDRVHVYRQSRVPAVAQMTALLSNVTSKGALNRAHAYKALVAANAAAGRDTDHGVNMGVFTYPVLMAADILAMRAHEVPVGADQAQHLEIAVELARAFAGFYGPGALREPQAVVAQTGGVLPGLDGRKMSKSHGNTIPLFAPPERAGQAHPPHRHGQPASGGPRGPGHLHPRRAARRVRRPGRRPRGPEPLPDRRRRLRRGQGPARRRAAQDAAATARPLRGAGGRCRPARRRARGGRAARQPARRRDPARDVRRHGAVTPVQLSWARRTTTPQPAGS